MVCNERDPINVQELHFWVRRGIHTQTLHSAIKTDVNIWETLPQ